MTWKINLPLARGFVPRNEAGGDEQAAHSMGLWVDELMPQDGDGRSGDEEQGTRFHASRDCLRDDWE